MRYLLIILSLVLFSCQSKKENKIQHHCSVKGDGTIYCTFTNTGNSPEGICLYAYFNRTEWDDDKHEYDFDNYENECGLKDQIGSKAFCSGIIEPKTTVEKEFNQKFRAKIPGDVDWNGKVYTPSEFCITSRELNKAFLSNYSAKWYAGCNLYFGEIPNP